MASFMFFWILYRFGYILANTLPLKVVYWIAERFADIHFFASKRDRDAVAQNLSIVLKKEIKDCYGMARAVSRNFGLYLADFFRMLRFNKEIVGEKVRIEGLENIERVFKQNRGSIALTCHIGNWELGGVVVAILGYKISAVVLNHKHQNINEFFIGQRAKQGVDVITVGSIMKRCISALRKGGMLALVGDRDFSNTGVMLDFFGVPTSIPRGPAALSLKTNSPIIPVVCIRENRYNYRLIFEEPIEIKRTAGVSEDELITRATKGLIPVMEKFVRMYPEQWLLFRRFWESPAGAVVI